MTDNLESSVKALIYSKDYIDEMFSFMNGMLAADRKANDDELSCEGEELEQLMSMWQEGGGTAVYCNPEPNQPEVSNYFADLLRQMVALSDQLAARYDPD